MKHFIFLSLLFILFGCLNKNTDREQPYVVAKSYCDCLQEQLKNAEDSSVILTNCEKTQYSKSRLMKIDNDYENRENYSRETLDSASKFAIQVGNIVDTLCYDKIDFKKVKKVPHIKM